MELIQSECSPGLRTSCTIQHDLSPSRRFEPWPCRSDLNLCFTYCPFTTPGYWKPEKARMSCASPEEAHVINRCSLLTQQEGESECSSNFLCSALICTTCAMLRDACVVIISIGWSFYFNFTLIFLRKSYESNLLRVPMVNDFILCPLYCKNMKKKIL